MPTRPTRRVGTKDQPEYRPKFCRTRRCTLVYGHDGSCNNRATPSRVTFPARPNRARGRNLPWVRGGLVRRSPVAAQVPGSRERMAAIREHTNRREPTWPQLRKMRRDEARMAAERAAKATARRTRKAAAGA